MRRRRVALLGTWLCVCGMCSALACETRDPTPVGRGARIFQRSCAGCHGPDGRARVPRVGLSKPPRDLTRAEFQSAVTNEQLRQTIRLGKGQMPAFGGLMADEDIADVIAFLRTLPPPGTPLPPGSVPAPSPGAAGGARGASPAGPAAAAPTSSTPGPGAP